MANEKSNGKSEEKTQVKMASIKFATNPDSVFCRKSPNNFLTTSCELSRILFLIRMSKVWRFKISLPILQFFAGHMFIIPAL
jgi:hypothetical protein